jgi:hypothetical protein
VPTASVDEPTEALEQFRGPVHFIEDDEFVLVLG